MTSQLYKSVHDALVGAALGGTFRPVTFDPDTKLATVDTESSVTPAEALANEISAEFSVPQRNRQTLLRSRSRWRWELIVGFHNGTVSLLEFEKALNEPPLRVAADPANGLPQVTLNLVSSAYKHPTRQSPSKGTQATFVFEASLGPI
ncbi:MAG: hypothetical protein ACF8XB_07395 [Planctomycetota bacterium JB042]